MELKDLKVGDEVILDNGNWKFIREIEKSKRDAFFVSGWWFSKKTGMLVNVRGGTITYDGRIIVPTKELIDSIKQRETIRLCCHEMHKKSNYIDYNTAVKILNVLKEIPLRKH